MLIVCLHELYLLTVTFGFTRIEHVFGYVFCNWKCITEGYDNSALLLLHLA